MGLWVDFTSPVQALVSELAYATNQPLYQRARRKPKQNFKVVPLMYFNVASIIIEKQGRKRKRSMCEK